MVAVITPPMGGQPVTLMTGLFLMMSCVFRG